MLTPVEFLVHPHTTRAELHPAPTWSAQLDTSTWSLNKAHGHIANGKLKACFQES